MSLNQQNTVGIILSRTDYGEADRIVTLLTPDQGKLTLMAKGVRRVKSKLAGGIELFSVSQITFVKGGGEVGTMISARLNTHYGNIVKDVSRTMLGYDLIKRLNRATEDEPEAEYFELLQQTFAALDDASVDVTLIQLWFTMQLITLAGHQPNLQTDTNGSQLKAEQLYNFDFDHMAFTPHDSGRFAVNHIKFLRIGFAGNQPKVLQQVQGSADLVRVITPFVQTVANSYLRV